MILPMQQFVLTGKHLISHHNVFRLGTQRHGYALQFFTNSRYVVKQSTNHNLVVCLDSLKFLL